MENKLYIDADKGKLIENGKPVTPDLSNDEHIEIIKNRQTAIDKGIFNFTIKSDLRLEFIFNCPCGDVSTLRVDADIEVLSDGSIQDENELRKSILGKKGTCWNCNSEYTIDCDEDGDVILKLTK
jgi:hypothetical protein